ncbi:MAG: fasciclin domain-containing protein [Prevotellaceae bacterium]|nr:fasciclin domain-containing protein [Candidatus Faecinaster equi]
MKKISYYIAFLIVACLYSCVDEVDKSAMFTFRGDLISSYMDKDEDMAYFATLTKRVKLSNKSESTVNDLLSARGNYTCFVPSNKAVQMYLDSVYKTENYDISQTPDSMAEFIVKNCMIDHENGNALLSTAFVEGAIEGQSFAGRFVTLDFTALPSGRSGVLVDKFSLITIPDIELSNGVIHKVDRVVSPTTSTLPDLIKEIPNLRLFSTMLQLTGWSEKTMAFRDLVYEAGNPHTGLGCPTETGNTPVPCPAHRDNGFTMFIEPDTLLCDKWGIDRSLLEDVKGNLNTIMDIIRQKCQEYYPNATSDDLTSEDNAVNQFVAYHILDRSIPYNLLNVHYNEVGFGYKIPENLTIDTWCYYPTMGKHRRLMKIMEGRDIVGKRINRYVSERNWDNYEELTVPREGLLISNNNGPYEMAALNGFYYIIDDLLVYDDDVPNKVLNERMRYDMCDLLKEQMSSGFRRITQGNALVGLNLPYGYFEKMTWAEESRVVYLCHYNKQIPNYQGDEYNIVGQYDVTFELPPVPYEGTYEIRLGMQNMADRRGMCQIYMGTNKENLNAQGLPLDMRIMGTNPSICWDPNADYNDDEDCYRINKIMRNHGYLNAPKYYGYANGGGAFGNYMSHAAVMRKIVYTGNMAPEKKYYMRCKNVLEQTTAQLYLDFIEIVPKTVYNGVNEEDLW